MSTERPPFGLNSLLPNNYKSKAEAFAKCLQDKLKSLGGGDEETQEPVNGKKRHSKDGTKQKATADSNSNFQFDIAAYPDDHIFVQHPDQMPYKQSVEAGQAKKQNGRQAFFRNLGGVVHDKRGLSSDSEDSDDEPHQNGTEESDLVLNSMKQSEVLHKRVQELLSHEERYSDPEERKKCRKLVSGNSEDSNVEWFSCEENDAEGFDEEEEIMDHFAAQIKGSPGIRNQKGSRGKKRGRKEEEPGKEVLGGRDFDVECFSPVNGDELEESEGLLPVNHMEELELDEYDVPYRILRESSSANNLEQHFSGAESDPYSFFAIKSLGQFYKDIEKQKEDTGQLLQVAASDGQVLDPYKTILTPPPSPEVPREEALANYVINVKSLDDLPESHLDVEAEKSDSAANMIELAQDLSSLALLDMDVTDYSLDDIQAKFAESAAEHHTDSLHAEFSGKLLPSTETDDRNNSTISQYQTSEEIVEDKLIDDKTIIVDKVKAEIISLQEETAMVIGCVQQLCSEECDNVQSTFSRAGDLVIECPVDPTLLTAIEDLTVEEVKAAVVFPEPTLTPLHDPTVDVDNTKEVTATEEEMKQTLDGLEDTITPSGNSKMAVDSIKEFPAENLKTGEVEETVACPEPNDLETTVDSTKEDTTLLISSEDVKMGKGEETVVCPEITLTSSEELKTAAESLKDKRKTVIDDDDDAEEMNPRMKLRRCSSLKTWKTPPGTPGRKKIVRFADALGLDLADVRTYLDAEIPKIPSSAYEDLQYEPPPAVEELPPPVQLSATLIPLFQQPGEQLDFLDRLRSNTVCLESAVLTDTKVFTISGCVRVRNMDFNKSVHVRYTIDSWQSFSDLQATYVPNSCDGFSDRFSFVLYGHTLKIGQQLAFAVRFECLGVQYWDSNDGTNYVFQCLPQSPSVSSYSLLGTSPQDDWSKFY